MDGVRIGGERGEIEGAGLGSGEKSFLWECDGRMYSGGFAAESHQLLV